MPDTIDIAVADIGPGPIEDAASNTFQIKKRKDWAPLRELAKTRARITLQTVWTDPAKGVTIRTARYQRFCYQDYGKGSLSIIETPTGISFNYSVGKGPTWHYCLSFRGGRMAFYTRRMVGTMPVVRRTLPFNLDLLAPIRYSKDAYDDAKRRFARRVIKLARRKARANGVKQLPKGDYDDIVQFISDAIWPSLRVVRDQHSILRGGTLLLPRYGLSWLMRHVRCEPDQIVKRMTGYDSRAVKRLFWEAMKAPAETSHNTSSDAWRFKWSWLALLRTWLPIDYTQAILKADKIAAWQDEFSEEPAKVRRLLKQWEPKQVVRMLTDTAADFFTIRDTLRQLETRTKRGGVLNPIPKTRNVSELHDWLMVDQQRWWRREREEREREQRENEARRLAAMTPEERAALEAQLAAEEARRKAAQAEADAPFNVEYGKDVDGKMVTTPDGATHTIIVPKDPADLKAWGESMHNCIGHYAHYIRGGYSLIFGVRTEGEPGGGRVCHWGIEVSPSTKDIVQFRGLQNCEPPKELEWAVKVEFAKAGVIELKDEEAALVLTFAITTMSAEQLV